MLTTRYPGVLLPGLPRLAGAGNLVGQLLTEAAIRLPFLPAKQAARRALGGRTRTVPKLSGSVYGISPTVIQAPAQRSHDRVVTGYWFDAIDADEALPPEVEDFLADNATDPVVSIGFGSMVAPDPEGLRGLLADAARSAGARVVLIAGAGAVGDTPAKDRSDLLVVPSIPHRALFHRMDVNVHHGGAGTTANALAAGVPSVVVPFGADQPFWGRRAADLGVAPPPIPISRLTRERLADALRLALSDPTMRSLTAGLGARIRSEDGTGRAAQWYGTLRV
jgi:UDP:flavonoid glycosyltransferase YjiC (YdhE family)